MKAILTGVNGAVGTGLKRHLEAQGHTVVGWDRRHVPIDDSAAMEAFIHDQHPDALFHLAIPSQSTGRENESWWVNHYWTGELARICRQSAIRFLFTSTVMVFTDHAVGPFTVESIPDAAEGYGYEKYQAEQWAVSQNPDTVVVRLGWQIGEQPGSNNMIDFFQRQMAEHGEVRASRRWLTACSFIGDTAAALTHLVAQPAGVYLVDSNTRWTFFEIASALNALHGQQWTITPSDDFVYDQRMVDPRVPVAKLDARLPALP